MLTEQQFTGVLDAVGDCPGILHSQLAMFGGEPIRYRDRLIEIFYEDRPAVETERGLGSFTPSLGQVSELSVHLGGGRLDDRGRIRHQHYRRVRSVFCFVEQVRGEQHRVGRVIGHHE